MVGEHLNRMEKTKTDTKTVGKITEWNLIGMRSKRRPKNTWGDEVLNYLNKLKVKNWTHQSKTGAKWCRRLEFTKGFVLVVPET